MKTKPIEKFAAYGGIVAVCFEWLAVLSFYIRKPSDFDGSHPLSYFATLPQTKLIFTLCYLVAALSFWIFARYHLSKHYQTPTKVFALAMIGFAAVAILPYNPDSSVSYALHAFAAFTFSASFIGAIFIMTKRNDDKVLKRVSLPIVLVSGVLTILIVAYKDLPLILVFEVIAGLACQVWTLWINYLTLRSAK